MSDHDSLHPTPILREFLGFLKRPAVLTPMGLRAPGALKMLGKLVALHVGVLLLLVLPILYGWQLAFALPAPDAFGKVAPKLLPLLVIVLAPLLEELVFRGWQTGRPRALWLLGCTIALVVLLLERAALSPRLAAGALGGIVLVAALGWFVLRRKATPGWYVRAFPATYYGVVLLFAGLHLINYPSAALLGIPMVLPQLWAALILGFVRLRIGLPASILAHAIANGTVLAMTMVTG